METKLSPKKSGLIGRFLGDSRYALGALGAAGTLFVVAVAFTSLSGPRGTASGDVDFTDTVGRKSSSDEVTASDSPAMRTFVAKIKDPRLSSGGQASLDSTRLLMSGEDMPFDMSQAGIRGGARGGGPSGTGKDGKTLSQMESIAQGRKGATVTSGAGVSRDAPGAAESEGGKTSAAEDVNLSEDRMERGGGEEAGKLKRSLAGGERAPGGFTFGLSQFSPFNRDSGDEDKDGGGGGSGGYGGGRDKEEAGGRRFDSMARATGAGAHGSAAWGGRGAFGAGEGKPGRLTGVEGAFTNARPEEAGQGRGELGGGVGRGELERGAVRAGAGRGADGGAGAAGADAGAGDAGAGDAGGEPEVQAEPEAEEAPAAEDEGMGEQREAAGPNLTEHRETRSSAASQARTTCAEKREKEGEPCSIIYDGSRAISVGSCPGGYKFIRTNKPYPGDGTCLKCVRDCRFFTPTGDPYQPLMSFDSRECIGGLYKVTTGGLSHYDCYRGAEILPEPNIDMSSIALAKPEPKPEPQPTPQPQPQPQPKQQGPSVPKPGDPGFIGPLQPPPGYVAPGKPQPKPEPKPAPCPWWNVACHITNFLAPKPKEPEPPPPPKQCAWYEFWCG